MKRAAVALSAAAMLSAGLLATASPAAAGEASAESGHWYTFQNVSSDLNLDAFGNNTVKSWTPDGSGTQGFNLRTGQYPGYQLESRYYPGKCVTAKSIRGAVTLESCNKYVQAQYWTYSVTEDEGSSFTSRKFPRGCIQDSGNRNAVTLMPCTGADNQRWIPLIH
ncbi:RICIN domain-containing protein [Streptomyces gobiensis]|uniref:RICIN domain-containing protein n=1 Tax=Streptomyces gobiensis TaxID=2875706 RepID=UPI001E54BA6A|nr:RICIN domain-containing protein [Streptomyces gobiensis]UGY95091.1 RICIN domain-containing protein [Streptomyces gobiensis]